MGGNAQSKSQRIQQEQEQHQKRIEAEQKIEQQKQEREKQEYERQKQQQQIKERDTQQLQEKQIKIDQLKQSIRKCQQDIEDQEKIKADKINIFQSQQFEFRQEDQIQYYHQQILFKSLAELRDGIEIINTHDEEQTQESFQKMIEQNYIIFGIIGNFNSGKTWLLGKLVSKSFKRGLNIRTEGFNIFYDELNFESIDSRVCFIDTAGSGEPIQTYINLKSLSDIIQDEETINEKIKDIENNKIESLKNIISSERFIQNFLLHESCILTIMVGIMTLEDERLINGVIEEFKKKRDHNQFERTIIIVHNFCNFSEKQQVEEQIAKDIFNNFEVEKNSQDPVFQQYIKDFGNTPIIHLVLAKDQSDAGKHYNPIAIKSILQHVRVSHTKLKKKNFIESFKQYLELNIQDYINFKKSQIYQQKEEENGENEEKQQQQEEQKEEKQKKEQNQQYLIEEQQTNFNNKEKQIDLGLKIEKSKEGKIQIVSQVFLKFSRIVFNNLIFDHFGQVENFYQDKYEPPYQLYEYNKNNESVYVIFILLPGVDITYLKELEQQQNCFEVQPNTYTNTLDFIFKAKIVYKKSIESFLMQQNIDHKMPISNNQISDKELNLIVRLTNRTGSQEYHISEIKSQHGLLIASVKINVKVKKLVLGKKK